MQTRRCLLALVLVTTIAACTASAQPADEVDQSEPASSAARADAGGRQRADVADASDARDARAVGDAGAMADASGALLPLPIDPNGCAFFANDAAPITAIQTPTTAPAATGGDIRPGRYHRTAFTVFTGPGGPSGPVGPASRETVEISQDHFSLATDQGPASMYLFGASGAYFYRVKKCPIAASEFEQMSVSVRESSFILYTPLGAGVTAASTYTLR